MVVEFENDNRTLYSVVEWVVGAVSPNPAKEGLIEVMLDLLFSHLARRVGQIQQELLGDVQQDLLLVGIELSDADSFCRHNAVVAEGATQVALIVLVPPVLYQIPRLTHARVAQQLEDLRLCFGGIAETLHQLETQFTFRLEDFYAFKLASVHDVRFGAGECG